jgi:hypothetical protein
MILLATAEIAILVKNRVIREKMLVIAMNPFAVMEHRRRVIDVVVHIGEPHNCGDALGRRN